MTSIKERRTNKYCFC